MKYHSRTLPMPRPAWLQFALERARIAQYPARAKGRAQRGRKGA